MGSEIPWQRQLKLELEDAQSACAAGNEGRARVCARRAAGIAIGEYLLRQGTAEPGPGAYDRLLFFKELPDISERQREIAQHLTTRVTVEFKLPLDVDLIECTRQLVADLLPELTL